MHYLGPIFLIQRKKELKEYKDTNHRVTENCNALVAHLGRALAGEVNIVESENNKKEKP